MPTFIAHMMSIWNVAAILVVLAMIVIVAVRWKSLPRELPGPRYDADGVPESWNNRRSAWYYPILTLVVIVVIGATDAGKMAPLSVFFAALLLYQMLRSFSIAAGRAKRLPPWFMPVFIFGTIGLAIFLSLT